MVLQSSHKLARQKYGGLRPRRLSRKHTIASRAVGPLRDRALVARPRADPALQIIRHRDLLTHLLVLLLVIDVLADHVAQHVLRRGDEDAALPERDEREHEEHAPREAHGDGHDEVPHVEALHVEDVAELPQGEDPADCVVIRVLVIGKRDGGARRVPFGNVSAQPGDGDGDGDGTSG